MHKLYNTIGQRVSFLANKEDDLWLDGYIHELTITDGKPSFTMIDQFHAGYLTKNVLETDLRESF